MLVADVIFLWGKSAARPSKEVNRLFVMVADSSTSRLVPLSLLEGASCLLPPTREFEAERERAARADLTSAEQRVCELLLRGLSNKEIAALLDRAEPTIKNQVASILRKYGVPSRMRLLALLR